MQPQYSPMPVGEQVAILYCGTHALMSDITVDQVPEFQDHFLDRMRSSHQDVLDALAAGKVDGAAEVIEKEAAVVAAGLKK